MKKIFIIIPAMMLLIIGFLAGYNYYSLSAVKYNANEFITGSNVFEYEIKKGPVFKDGHGILTGYLYEKNSTVTLYNYGLSVEETGVYNNNKLGIIVGEKVYLFPTKPVYREDLNPHKEDEIDYKYCGFNVYVPSKYAKNYSDNEIVLVSENLKGEKCIIYTDKRLGEYFE